MKSRNLAKRIERAVSVGVRRQWQDDYLTTCADALQMHVNDFWSNADNYDPVLCRRFHMLVAELLYSVPFPRHLRFGDEVAELAGVYAHAAHERLDFGECRNNVTRYIRRIRRQYPGWPPDPAHFRYERLTEGYFLSILSRLRECSPRNLESVAAWVNGATNLTECAACGHYAHLSRQAESRRERNSLSEPWPNPMLSKSDQLRVYKGRAIQGQALWIREISCNLNLVLPGGTFTGTELTDTERCSHTQVAEACRHAGVVMVYQKTPRLADLFRDVMRSPAAVSQGAVIKPGWLTSTVANLVYEIDDSADYSTMPILADALQDADCDDAEILDHLRANKPHGHGCWVFDAIFNAITKVDRK